MRHTFLTVAVLGAAFITGCKDEPAKVTPVMPDKSGTNVPTTGPTMGEKAMNGIDAATQKAADKAADMKDKMTGDSAKAQEEAGKLMEQVGMNMKDKKWPDAKAALAKLDDLKAKLPADWQAKIDGLKASITAAETADTVKVPEGVKVPDGVKLPGGN